MSHKFNFSRYKLNFPLFVGERSKKKRVRTRRVRKRHSPRRTNGTNAEFPESNECSQGAAKLSARINPAEASRLFLLPSFPARLESDSQDSYRAWQARRDCGTIRECPAYWPAHCVKAYWACDAPFCQETNTHSSRRWKMNGRVHIRRSPDTTRNPRHLITLLNASV